MAEVFGGQGGEFQGGDAAEGCEGGCGVGDQGGLVALAAVGDGGEKGAVGLDQNAVRRGCESGIADGLRLWVGEIAGEGEVEACGE